MAEVSVEFGVKSLYAVQNVAIAEESREVVGVGNLLQDLVDAVNSRGGCLLNKERYGIDLDHDIDVFWVSAHHPKEHMDHLRYLVKSLNFLHLLSKFELEGLKGFVVLMEELFPD